MVLLPFKRTERERLSFGNGVVIVSVILHHIGENNDKVLLRWVDRKQRLNHVEKQNGL